ncbi:MAG: AAA family ATPase [Saprospiraceae bacterium]|nr:AAA family ATPase [Saprospiraceae bacterium]
MQSSVMDYILEKSERKIAAVSTTFQRSLMDKIAWNNRLIGIRGARGVGKTTLLLQHLQLHTSTPSKRLYLNLDDMWFTTNDLRELVEWFAKRGGRYLYLDEVHKYPHWSQTIKNIYDDHPGLQIVFTGSSMLEMLNARADLSRRALSYRIQGLSFREFLNVTLGTDFTAYSLDQILQNPEEISREIVGKIRPLQYFADYLSAGYYPFFLEDHVHYHSRIEEVVRFILDVELPQLRGTDIANIPKLKQLLQIIAELVPFTPNVSKLAERMHIERNTLATYLHYLSEAQLTLNLFKQSKGITRLQKPDKIYLENANLLYALAPQNVNLGSTRETFFINQLNDAHTLTYAEKGDFNVDDKYTFEIGGKHKTYRQIAKLKNAFIAADDIEYGVGQKIPLWMFGFLY